MLEKILTRLGQLGWPRRRGASLERFAVELERSEELPIDELRAAFAAYQDVRFGKRHYDTSRRDSLDTALAAVRRCDRRVKSER